MRFDVGKFANRLESKSPILMKALSMKILGFVSPFNSHLKLRLTEWTPLSTKITMSCHRGVKNHVGGIHAGALFTLGETCAGLIIVRNFSFSDYRPLMTDVSVNYSKQARGKVMAEARVTEASLKRVKTALKKGDAFVPMETLITNEKSEPVALVKTRWQIKAWHQVRAK